MYIHIYYYLDGCGQKKELYFRTINKCTTSAEAVGQLDPTLWPALNIFLAEIEQVCM
jgi:hypothetical protein